MDGDTRSLRVLEVSLRKAGFSVTPAVSVGDALDKLEVNTPDLIISETKFSTELDGFELRRRLLAAQAWSGIPFIFLTAETAIENKIKGLELGVDDYLTKPIYIKEIITRINILLQKRQRQFLDAKKDGTRFAGRVADMPVVDVIQTIEVSRKSGVIQFSGGPNRQAAIYFRDGKVIDAEAGTLQGEDAVYRLLTWNDGEFEVEFRTVRRREAITTSSQGLLMEGMRRLDEWSRLLEQLPPITHRFEIDAAELSQRLGEVPDENNRILRLFDSKRTLIEVIDASDFGDLECLQAISRLYFEGMLIDLDQGAEERPRRDTGRPMPLDLVSDAGPRRTPMEVVASGPIDLQNLEQRASANEIPVPLPMGQSGPVMAAIEAQPSMPVRTNVVQVDSGPVGGDPEPPEPSHEIDIPTETRPVPEFRPRRDSGEIVSDQEVLSEEEAPLVPPLMGSYRPSSLRLIDEAVAAAQLIEPSLFSDEELAAAGVTRPAPPESTEPPPAASETPLARVQLAQRAPDPRLDNAKDLVEKGPANGRSDKRRTPTLPPPLPLSARMQKEIDDAPLLEADLVTSGEFKIPSEAEIADAPMLDIDPDTSGEIKASDLVRTMKTPTAPPPIPGAGKPAEAEPTPAPVEAAPQPAEEEDSGGVPSAIEHDDQSGDLADEGPTDPSRRRLAAAATIKRDEALRMIGSHGKDRAEASGELKPVLPKGAESETQREVVTIMPRRITREVPQIPDGKPAEAEADAKTETTGEDTKAAGAVEAPSRPPPRRVSVEGGVVKPSSGPGKLAVILLTLASVLIGATVFSYCRKNKPSGLPIATREDAPAIIETQDAEQYAGFGIDAPAEVETPDAAQVVQVKPDAAVVAQRPDAAVAPPDAAQVVVARPDAAQVAVAPVDAAVDEKAKEAKALYDKAHAALEDGDPQTALTLLDQSLALKKSARTYMEKARALQRLQKTDEAVAAADDAIKAKGGAAAVEQKGMILWAAQRYPEARVVFEQYLEQYPTSKKAATIRALLEENK